MTGMWATGEQKMYLSLLVSYSCSSDVQRLANDRLDSEPLLHCTEEALPRSIQDLAACSFCSSLPQLLLAVGCLSLDLCVLYLRHKHTINVTLMLLFHN